MKKRIDEDIGIHLGTEIRKELNIQKRTVAWLANEIGHDASNLGKQLNNQFVPLKWLINISKVLKKDFISLYSNKLADEKL